MNFWIIFDVINVLKFLAFWEMKYNK